ncbi:MAG: hypothetical protein IPP90_10045 [Gemmatimonadaceae bacterium]|nr:hypothetical protein [Gemmatimonadaceae bacterium]
MKVAVALLLALSSGIPRVSLGQPPYQQAADSARLFPSVSGSNLEGRKFSLPADFGGDFNVVLVAFKREQQNDVDTWLPFLRETTARRSDVRVYELPTLNRGYRFMRGVIDGGMARGIPERATREATITLYIDKSPFKQALGIDSESQIRIYLVARGGRVLWHGNGRYSEELASALAAMLAK